MLITILTNFTITLAVLLLFIVLFMLVMIFKMTTGRAAAKREISSMKINKISDPRSVDSLSIIPIVDYYAADKGYSTEEGVAYIIKAGGSTILFDLGLNKRKEHPSPLISNLARAGIALKDIDKIFISHIHSDHIGGLSAQRNRQFSLSAGRVDLTTIPVYAPGEISPSENNPQPYVKIIKEPVKIDEGIVSIGIYPRSLFLIGYTAEQSLAINVKGKGLVIIIGCGHQGIENILKRVEDIFDELVYGIIGGLHLPVNGGRFMVGPFNLQNIVGVDRNPFRGIREIEVESAIKAIKKVNPEIISLSPHDSSDWTIEKFKEAFGDKYIELLAGEKITI